MSEEATLDDFAKQQGESVNEEIEAVPESSVESSLDETSVGKIPEDWMATRLGDIAEETEYGLTESAEEYDPNKPRYIRTQDFDDFGGLKENSRASLSREKAKDGILEEGDMLFARSGSVGASLGKTYLYDSNDGDCCFGGYSIRHQLQNVGLNHKYISKYTLSDQYWNWVRRRAKTTAQSNINTGEYGSLLLPIPPLSEQRKIATVLYTIDQAIKKTEEIIRQIETTGKGLRQTLFSEGYYDHETESYGTLGQVPSDWEKTRLYKIADVSRGKFTHRPRNDPAFYDGEYPFIQTGEVVDAVGELSEYSQTLNEKGRGVSKEFAPGTIIITIAGNIGDTAVATFPVYFPDSLVGITPNEDVDGCFLEHYLRYRQDFLNRLSTKTTQKNLNLTLLRPIEVVKPSLEEQKKIAEALTSVDNQMKREKQYKKQLQWLKQGLMQDLLSGTVRTTDTNITVPDEVAQHG